jgi:hypothetical protein
METKETAKCSQSEFLTTHTVVLLVVVHAAMHLYRMLTIYVGDSYPSSSHLAVLLPP